MDNLKVNADNWYVLYTVPNLERKIASHLSNNSIETYLPLIKVEKNWSDRVKIIEQPLFPSYVFVKIARKNLWHALATKGVVKALSIGNTPSVIDEEEINLIKKIISSTHDVCTESDFSRGDYVKILEGPLTGLEGKIIEVKGVKRLSIYLQVMNQIISIKILNTQLQKAADYLASSKLLV